MNKFTNLLAALASLTSHVTALQAASTPTDVTIATLTDAVNTVDTEVVAATQPIGPGPTGVDFTAFDAAVAAFKADSKLSQADVDAVAHVLNINTP